MKTLDRESGRIISGLSSRFTENKVSYNHASREYTCLTLYLKALIVILTSTQVLNSIAFVIIYIQQVKGDSADYTPHRLKTNCCSLSHGRFWMWRWRMDTGHEDKRQQRITLNQLSTRIRQELLSAISS